jgi:hypothetical protein
LEKFYKRKDEIERLKKEEHEENKGRWFIIHNLCKTILMLLLKYFKAFIIIFLSYT